MDAQARFRRSVESLVDELEELADSGIVDHRASLDRIRESYYTAHGVHGCEYVRETFCSTAQDWQTTLEIAGTMARSARTTPRSWLINSVSEQWNKKCQAVTSSYVLVDGLLGPLGHAEAGRRTRVRFREIYNEQAITDTTPAPPMPSPAADAPAAAVAVASEPLPPVRPTFTAKDLQERRDRLDRFIDSYRRAKGRKPTNEQIAIVSHYRNRSAVEKYLTGEASEASVQNIEETLTMSPDKFDTAYKSQKQRLQ
jgi:hypothetical protein